MPPRQQSSASSVIDLLETPYSIGEQFQRVGMHMVTPTAMHKGNMDVVGSVTQDFSTSNASIKNVLIRHAFGKQQLLGVLKEEIDQSFGSSSVCPPRPMPINVDIRNSDVNEHPSISQSLARALPHRDNGSNLFCSSLFNDEGLESLAANVALNTGEHGSIDPIFNGNARVGDDNTIIRAHAEIVPAVGVVPLARSFVFKGGWKGNEGKRSRILSDDDDGDRPDIRADHYPNDTVVETLHSPNASSKNCPDQQQTFVAAQRSSSMGSETSYHVLTFASNETSSPSTYQAYDFLPPITGKKSSAIQEHQYQQFNSAVSVPPSVDSDQYHHLHRSSSQKSFKDDNGYLSSVSASVNKPQANDEEYRHLRRSSSQKSIPEDYQPYHHLVLTLPSIPIAEHPDPLRNDLNTQQQGSEDILGRSPQAQDGTPRNVSAPVPRPRPRVTPHLTPPHSANTSTNPSRRQSDHDYDVLARDLLMSPASSNNGASSASPAPALSPPGAYEMPQDAIPTALQHQRSRKANVNPKHPRLVHAADQSKKQSEKQQAKAYEIPQDAIPTAVLQQQKSQKADANHKHVQPKQLNRIEHEQENQGSITSNSRTFRSHNVYDVPQDALQALSLSVGDVKLHQRRSIPTPPPPPFTQLHEHGAPTPPPPLPPLPPLPPRGSIANDGYIRTYEQPQNTWPDNPVPLSYSSTSIDEHIYNSIIAPTSDPATLNSNTQAYPYQPGEYVN